MAARANPRSATEGAEDDIMRGLQAGADAYLVKPFGELLVFGMPHYQMQEFPWFHTVCNETEIITSMGPECMEYFQNAVDMIIQGRTDLIDMVTPRMPWEKAAEAFKMYADPAHAEGSLKLTLVL